jgi:hypothetical protein
MSLLSLTLGGIFLFLEDIHGPAVMFGAAIALILIWFDRRGMNEQV